MICKIQVVTVGEDGRKETREITSIQRADVKPETLGLTLAEGKMILKDLQLAVTKRPSASTRLASNRLSTVKPTLECVCTNTGRDAPAPIWCQSHQNSPRNLRRYS